MIEFAVALFLVHTVEGREVYVNPENVITLSAGGHLVTERAQCVITLNDAKFITVREHCDEVRRLMNLQEAGGPG